MSDYYAINFLNLTQYHENGLIGPFCTISDDQVTK